MVLIDRTGRCRFRHQVARTHGLERLSSQPLPLLGAHIGLFRIRGARSDAAVLAALQQDGRVRSAQLNQRYFHSKAASRRRQPFPSTDRATCGCPKRTSWRSAAT